MTETTTVKRTEKADPKTKVTKSKVKPKAKKQKKRTEKADPKTKVTKSKVKPKAKKQKKRTEKADPKTKVTKSKVKPKAKKQKKRTVRKGTEEKAGTIFTFKNEDGSLTSIPMTGEVNCIELQQENRTDWLFTRLPKELALKYSLGDVKTRYADAKGDRCIIITKYRGDAIDANKPKQVGECYTLLFSPHYATKNAELEKIDEGITDKDITHSILALDESKALKFKNKYLNERLLRIEEQDYNDLQDRDYRRSITRVSKKTIDDVDIGEKDMERDMHGSDITNLAGWIGTNWLWLLIFGGAVLFILSMFGG